MWLSATSFFFTYHRVYSPAHFARKYDRSGAYIRAWLPALKAMPGEFIYEPWKAPASVQRAAGCMVGEHYPAPICDLRRAAEFNMLKMDVCYSRAPPEWKAMVPRPAVLEVARERGVDISTPVRVKPFAPRDSTRCQGQLRRRRMSCKNARGSAARTQPLTT